MRLFSVPSAVLGLVALTVLPSVLAKPYPVHLEELRELHNATQLEKRACAASEVGCGFGGWLCCPSGSPCYTDSADKAYCTAPAGAAAAPAPTGGQWVYSTSIWVASVGVVTYTSVYSTYVPAVVTATCQAVQSPCNGKCCDSGFFCNTKQQCERYGGGSSGGIFPTGILTPSAPSRPTNSGNVIVTYTGTPTMTTAFFSGIPTGAAGTMVPVPATSGGLSGGAIAGIVIGVILGILLLLLLCLFCCARALFDTIAAIFGFGKKRKHTHEETYIEEHHHSSGGGAAAGGRWYGQGRPSRPSRPSSEKKGGIGKGLGMAAALGGLALALGLKRKHDRKHDDKSTTISGSSAYYSDYTSSSSASSSDRHTRRTGTRGHSSRR